VRLLHLANGVSGAPGGAVIPHVPADRKQGIMLSAQFPVAPVLYRQIKHRAGKRLVLKPPDNFWEG
jgi:hypothetical protein